MPEPEPAPAPEKAITLRAVLESSPPLQRVALGLLVVVLGGILMPHTLLLGLPILAAGAWLTTGRGAIELGREMKDNAAYLVQALASLAFFCGAIYQATFSLAPMVPLFAISFLLLPPRAGAARALRLPPVAREFLVVVMIGVWAQLLVLDLQDRAEAGLRDVAAKVPKPQWHASPAETLPERPAPRDVHWPSDSPRSDPFSTRSAGLYRIAPSGSEDAESAELAPARDDAEDPGPLIYVPSSDRYYPASRYARSYSAPRRYASPDYAQLSSVLPYAEDRAPRRYVLLYYVEYEAPP
jgi:hypothetical protein